jgi:hypothetical protein
MRWNAISVLLETACDMGTSSYGPGVDLLPQQWRNVRDLRRDAGVEIVEYGAALLVVASIVGVLATSDLGRPISSGISSAICRVFGGSCGQQGPANAQPQGARGPDGGGGGGGGTVPGGDQGPQGPGANQAGQPRGQGPQGGQPGQQGQQGQPGQRPATGPPGTPNKPANPCRSTAIRWVTHDKNVKIVGYRRNHQELSIVEKDDKGQVSITTGEKTGNGGDIRVGFGGKVGGIGAGVDAGGGQLAAKGERIRRTFPNEAVHKEYDRRVAARLKALQDSPLARDSNGVRRPDRLAEQVRREVAQEMRIPTARTILKGDDSMGSIGGTYGVGSAQAGADDSNLRGQTIDDNGTADPRDDIRTQHYWYTKNVSGSGGAGFEVGPAAAGGQVEGGKGDGGWVDIEYRNGKPTKLSILRFKNDFIDGNVGVGPTGGKGKASGEAAGSQGQAVVTPGKWVMERDEIDLTKDPKALAAYQSYRFAVDHGQEQIGGAGLPQQAWDRFARSHLQGPAVARTRQIYDRDLINPGGIDASGSIGIEIGAYQQSNSDDQMHLRRAEFFDPKTGQWRPWKSCTG